MFVLLLKGNGNHKGIIPIEVLWNTVTGVINCRIRDTISYHDVLHGFRAGRSTGKKSIEPNLIQHLTVTREEILYEVFLDLQKEYYALEQERRMEVLVAYILGTWTELLLCRYWKRLTIVAISGSYYGTPLKGPMGVMQGNLLSPTTLNMAMDAVICHWETVVAGADAGPEGFGRALHNLSALFYA